MAGEMGHGPEMFQTFNQQHNPLQKFGKIAKTYGALRQGLRWAPMGPMGQPLKKTTTVVFNSQRYRTLSFFVFSLPIVRDRIRCVALHYLACVLTNQQHLYFKLPNLVV